MEELESKGDRVTRFSVTGYSLGGLVARYLIGWGLKSTSARLRGFSSTQCSVLYHKGFFENVTPVNFNTIATPHAGLPRYPSFLSSISTLLGPKLLSRTGEQFFCVDKWSRKGRPLLIVMADPGEILYYYKSDFIINSSRLLDQIFHKSLSKFQHIRIYANAQVNSLKKTSSSCLIVLV